ncbi:MAG: NfeD family protein [Ectobacillus sp.]
MAGWVVWLLIAGGLVIAEMLTFTFYLLWLGIGALFGGIVAFFVPDLWTQVIVASIVSLVLTVFSKPIVKKIRMGRGYTDPVDTIVGKTGIVMQNITDEANGIVKVSGDTWSATAAKPISRGERVVVLGRRSTVLLVRKESE